VEYKCAPASCSLPGDIRLENETLHGLAVDEIDLDPRGRVTLSIFTLATADLAALCWLLQFEAFGAFAGYLQLELAKQ